MEDRYAYLDTWDELTPDVFKAVFHYARMIAEKDGEELTLVVNNVKQCSDFISKFLDQVTTNKLSKGEILNYKGVQLSLKSPFSLKDYQHYGVFCAFHPSDMALTSMENSKEPRAIVILGEKEDHLESWLSVKKGKLLAQN